MRVYFAPCGIGLGHAGRVIPIARKLLEINAEVMFSTYGEAIRFVENERLPLVKAPPIRFQVKPDGSIDFRRTAIIPGPFLVSIIALAQIQAEVRFIESFHPDVIVSDSRVSPLLAARILGIPRICILNQFQVIVPRREHHLWLAKFADSITLTLIGKMWTSGNVVLVPDFPPPYTISAGNLNIPKAYKKRVRLIGPVLEVHPNELPSKDAIRKKLGLPSEKRIIFAAISGSTKEKAFLIGTLQKILFNFPQNYEVIMSLGYPEDDSKPTRSGNLTVYSWIPNRFEYLKACDVIVARAGHGTITQAMCYGKPMILIPTPGHTEQINNAKHARDLGVARILPQKELNKERLQETIQQIMESEVPHSMENIQGEVLKHLGIGNAVKIISEIATGKHF